MENEPNVNSLGTLEGQVRLSLLLLIVSDLLILVTKTLLGTFLKLQILSVLKKGACFGYGGLYFASSFGFLVKGVYVLCECDFRTQFL